MRWRLDGVLQPLCEVPKEVGPNIIARLKVLAGLLTYEMSLPQEGRIWDEALRVEVRVSTFPTLYGERAVLRLLGASNGAGLAVAVRIAGGRARGTGAESGGNLRGGADCRPGRQRQDDYRLRLPAAHRFAQRRRAQHRVVRRPG